MTLESGDIIRVKDWPGTRGKRFTVLYSEVHVYTRDQDGRQRAFPADSCVLYKKATK